MAGLLEGQVALITGGSAGIGRAAVKLFAEAGFKGYMCFEGDEVDSPEAPAVITQIRNLCKKYSSV